jgi:hypothetical protein
VCKPINNFIASYVPTFKQMKQLKTAQKELNQANQQLVDLNTALQSSNLALNETNNNLKETNMVRKFILVGTWTNVQNILLSLKGIEKTQCDGYRRKNESAA